MKSNSEILQKAKSKIQNGWIKKCYALNEADAPVEIDSKDGCKFCAIGAIVNSSADQGEEYSRLFHNPIVQFFDGIVNANSKHSSTESFNDDPKTTKEDVLDMFDKAISAAISRERTYGVET